MEKEAIYLSDIHDPIVKVGTLIGQDLYVKLRGHDTREREKNFLLTKKIMTNIIEGDVRTKHTEKCHWTGVHTMECYCNA